MQYCYNTSLVPSKVSAASTLWGLHPVQGAPAVSHSVPTSSFPSGPHHTNHRILIATVMVHHEASQIHCLPPTCRLSQALPRVSKPFPRDNSAIQLCWHRRITPIQASSFSLKLTFPQQSTNYPAVITWFAIPIVPHTWEHVLPCSLLVPSFVLPASHLWIWIISPEQQSLSSHETLSYWAERVVSRYKASLQPSTPYQWANPATGEESHCKSQEKHPQCWLERIKISL